MVDPKKPAPPAGIQSGRVDVGTVYVDLKQIYLDARSNAVELDQPHLQYAAMFVMVDMIGRIVEDVTVLRSKLTHVDSGLLGFDDDLAGLTARYTIMYRPLIESEPPFDLTDPQQYALFERGLEGPILIWDRKTCIEEWPTSVGHCEGPELLTALSMLHQVGVAEELEKELLQSYIAQAHTLFTEIIEMASGIASEAANAAKEALKEAGQTIAEGARSVADAAEEHLVKPTLNKVAIGVGVVATGFAGYLAWKSTTSNNKGTQTT